jgi:uncharacterized membrane protein YhaH (DUF805 family)
VDWYLAALKKYAVFDGRAPRREYWLFTLLNLAIFVILIGVDFYALGATALDTGVLSTVYSVAVIMPSVAVAVRRLHDTNRSAWWFLIGFVPIGGGIALVVLLCLAGTAGNNRYGPPQTTKPGSPPGEPGLEDS